MKISRAHVWEEFWKLVRFGIVGGLSFAIHSLTYLLQSRLLWQDGPRFWQNALSVTVASLFNFLAHRSWTYRAQKTGVRQLGRYVITMVTAAAFQSFVFWFGHTILGIYDLIALIVAVGCAALFTYAGHRWFTFPHPKKTGESTHTSMDPVL